MKADYLTYRRATGVSLLGAAIQAVMGLGLLVYAYRFHDHAALTAAGFILLGLPAWLSLAFVFDQHRRERLEDMEAESLARADAAAASAFESAKDELRVAAKRLSGLYRWYLPAASLVLAAALVGWGLFRFGSGRKLVAPDDFHKPEKVGWAVALGIVIAIVGFMLARYVAGMAKIRVWSNLRAGAGYAVGSALLGLVLAIGHGVYQVGSDTFLRSLNVAYPIVMLVLGAEIFVNFLMDLYRPRKPGEVPRIAFESRVLGFASAPDKIAESISDAINYQLGYNVTQGWFYQLLSRSLWKLLAFGVLVMWVMSSLVVIRPDQRALVLRFGKLSREAGPGLLVKWPWPIERVEAPAYLDKRPGEDEARVLAYTTTGVRTLQVGTSPPTKEGPILWTTEHTENEKYLVVQPSRVTYRTEGGQVSGPDLALLAVEIPVHYAVSDVRAFELLGPPEMRHDILLAVAKREATRYLATRSVDDMLGPGRLAASAEFRTLVERAFAGMNVDPATGQARGAGVEVLYVGVEGVHPPGGMDGPASLYEAVIEAQHKTATMIEEARGDAASTLTAVVGSVDLATRIEAELNEKDAMAAAGADSQAVAAQELKVQQMIEASRGEAAAAIVAARLEEYRGLLASYQASPGLFRATRYLEGLSAIMRDARVFVTDPGVSIRFDGAEINTGVNVFDPNAGAPPGQ